MVEVDILDFMKKCKQLAKEALGKHAGEPEEGGLARWKHVVIQCYRREEGHGYRETENRLLYYSDLREVLELGLQNVPDYSTICKSFDRFEMWGVAGVAAHFSAATPAIGARRSR